MTNGTSQGLFVVVAIIIFGIFVLISYMLFKDNLKPTLANIFTDGLEQAKDSLANSQNKDSTDITGREDENYIYTQLREADESKNESAIWIKTEKLADNTLSIIASSTYDGGYTQGMAEMTGNLNLPDSINGKFISIIGMQSFQNALFTGTIHFPKNITKIDAMSFLSSRFTGNLTLPNTIQEINRFAFAWSKFSGNLTLPANLKSVDYGAFRASEFSGDLTIPEKTTLISFNAFAESEFSSVNVLGTTDIKFYSIDDTLSNTMNSGSAIGMSESSPQASEGRAFITGDSNAVTGTATTGFYYKSK